MILRLLQLFLLILSSLFLANQVLIVAIHANDISLVLGSVVLGMSALIENRSGMGMFLLTSGSVSGVR